MKILCKILVFSLISNGVINTCLKAQNATDACSTCKIFCSKFSSPLSFNALSSAMSEVDEYCDGIQNPTRHDTRLCEKYSLIKVSFVKDFSLKNSLEDLCGTAHACKEECPPREEEAGELPSQKIDKKQECAS